MSRAALIAAIGLSMVQGALYGEPPRGPRPQPTAPPDITAELQARAEAKRQRKLAKRKATP